MFYTKRKTFNLKGDCKNIIATTIDVIRHLKDIAAPILLKNLETTPGLATAVVIKNKDNHRYYS